MKIVVYAMLVIMNASINISWAADPDKAEAFSFRTTKVEIGGKKLTVEVAENGRQHQRGLMFRTKLDDGAGMLFVFPDESPRSFWMKNTFVPLSIAYLSSQKKVIDIIDMAPAASEAQAEFPFYNSSGPAMYALEVPQGWFAKNNIKVGDELSFVEEKGKKKKTKREKGRPNK